MADTIDIPKEVQLLESSFNKLKERMDKVTQQITKNENISQLNEEEVNQVYFQLRLLQFKAGEFEMMQQIYFFESETFIEEGVTYEHIQLLGKFTKHIQPILDNTCSNLDSFMVSANENMKKKRLALREEQLKNISSQEAEIDVENLMSDFAAEANSAIASLKTQQQETNEILNSGEDKMNELQDVTQANIKGVKEATGTVRKAMDALKKNKDLLFMGSALLMLLALVLILIIT
ncbi:Hypothetical_protein [Hexamita inflata]|uniref:Hypothetical_protein n=1 Tax=Hexamita inflata TaxID=28002 RepID=A0ABP1HYV9_9EUKA